jgi:hypothetical protein
MLKLNNRTFVLPKQAAASLQVTRQRISSLCKSGQLRHIKIAGQLWVDADDVDARIALRKGGQLYNA